MPSRTAALAALTVAVTTVALPLAATPAHADVPSALGSTALSDPDYGNGGPATQALVSAGAMTRASDGAIVFFDTAAHEIRRVDGTTGVVTRLAGTGAVPPGTYGGETLATGVPATSVDMYGVAGLWTTTSGDVYAQPTSGSSTGNLYRLDHTDGQWHLALQIPQRQTSSFSTHPGYAPVAVAPNGDVLAVDGDHSVIRRIPQGSDPTSTGTVVAGTLDTPGTAGDGGPATAATITTDGPLVAASDGSFVFGSSARRYLRRVAADGTISTVAGLGFTPSNLTISSGAGQQSAATAVHAVSLALSPDEQTLYVDTDDQASHNAVLSFPVTGGTTTLVAGPSARCYPTNDCIGDGIAATGTQLLAGTTDVVRSWPVDGSGAGASGAVAMGLDGAASPDGTPLSRAVLGYPTAVAVAPDGHVAMATSKGLFVLTSADPGATVSRLATVSASALSYGPEGTLYALTHDTSTGATRIVGLSAAGTVTPLVGGGSSTLADGTTGTDLALPSYQGVRLEADPAGGRVLFDTGTADVFAVDTASDAVSVYVTPALVSGHPGSLAMTAAGLYVAVDAQRMLRVDSDRSVHDVPCTGSCLGDELEPLPNGSLVGDANVTINQNYSDGDSAVVQAPSGASAFLLGTRTAGARTTTPDGRVLRAFNDPAGAALSLSDPVPTPADVDAPQVSVTAGPASIDVDITPTTTAQQRYRVLVTPLPGGSPVELTAVDNQVNGAGSTAPLHVHLLRSVPGYYGAPPLQHGTTYAVTVTATELSQDRPTLNWVNDVPVTTDVEPLVDATGPAAPGLALLGQGYDTAHFQVTLPGDVDLDKVVVRRTTGTTPATSPTDGDLSAEIVNYPGVQTSFDAPSDPLVTSTFTAFALDTTGNASAPVSVTRAAATLTTGTAATGIGYQAGNGVEAVTWAEEPVTFRYAAGTTPPATPKDGSAGGPYSGGGYGTTVPVAKGAKVAVSLFAWSDNTYQHYRRTSFVLTGGTSSDAMVVSASAPVNPGTRPAVKVTLTRTSPTGTKLPLVGQFVVLYRRAVGASAWTLVGGASTSSAGVATYTVPTVTGATDYQARYVSFMGQFNPDLTALATARTTVRQLLTGALSATTVRHGTVVRMSGNLNGHRATRIYLQRYVGGKWVNLTSAVSASNGNYVISWKPLSAASYTLRAYVPATSTLLAGAGPNRGLRAT